MAVRIRLSRGGSKKRPFYRIVVADARAPRDGRFIEKLGSYNPLLPQDRQDRIVLDVEKTKTWLSKGALPTDRLQKILSNMGLYKSVDFSAQTKQSAPRAKAQERAKEKAAAAEAAALAAKEAEEAAKVAKEAPAAEEASAE